MLVRKGAGDPPLKMNAEAVLMVDSCFEPPRSHKMEVLQSQDEEVIVLLGKRIIQSEKQEGGSLFTDQ